MVCKDGLPLDFSEGTGYRRYAKVSTPLWTPIGRNTVTRDLEKKYSAVRDIVKNNLSTVESVTLTFNVWTSQHTTTS